MCICSRSNVLYVFFSSVIYTWKHHARAYNSGEDNKWFQQGTSRSGIGSVSAYLQQATVHDGSIDAASERKKKKERRRGGKGRSK